MGFSGVLAEVTHKLVSEWVAPDPPGLPGSPLSQGSISASSGHRGQCQQLQSRVCLSPPLQAPSLVLSTDKVRTFASLINMQQ